jgi:hypothetical protein
MPFDNTNTYQFGITPLSFINYGKKARNGNVNEIIPMSVGIEQILDLESSWQMKDTIQPLSMAHINFTGTHPTFQFRTKTGQGAVCNITRHALKQLGVYIQQTGLSGRKVNPYQLTESLCIQDDEYRRIATVAWSKMLDNMGDKEVLFRSKVINGTRTITSIQSVSYAPIKDSELLLKLQSQNPDLHFVGANVNSISSNYRLIENVDEITLNNPVDMYDIHNSDGGLRELLAFYKKYILKCTNGMFSTETVSSFNNRHYGDRELIVGRFGQAIEDFVGVNDGFINQYYKARETEISDLWTIMNYRLNGSLTKNQIENANLAFNSDLIASEKGTLGHAIDTLTLSAQAEKDPFERHLLEGKATQFMNDIFADLEKGKELIPLKVLEEMAI